MALYYEAASIINSVLQSGESLKATVFSKKTWKSDAKTLFALSTETAKWSEILAEVIEIGGLLKTEKNLSPSLALVLSHDLLLSKRGIALPAQHGLAVSITRYKARLQAELTKARLRRGFASLEALRSHVNSSSTNSSLDAPPAEQFHPRWVRINTLQTSMEEQLQSTFKDCDQVSSLEDLRKACTSDAKAICADEHIPSLLAVHPHFEITTTKAYKQGKLVLQDKASCFPAYLLDPRPHGGHIIDACAAPGNKTTHLAAILRDQALSDDDTQETSEQAAQRRIIACERDPKRSETLRKMLKTARAEHLVQVRTKQDFTRLDPKAKEFSRVTSLLLDPSCSGSGIVARHDNSLKIHLPSRSSDIQSSQRGKKRKRGATERKTITEPATTGDVVAEEVPHEIDEDYGKLQARLNNLADFQLRILKHAMTFPAANRITYSTCSIYATENEAVVARALFSDIARRRGWRIMERQEQVEGLRKWTRRGDADAFRDVLQGQDRDEAKILPADPEELAAACIRCVPGTREGTMGFFLCAFVRDTQTPVLHSGRRPNRVDSQDEESEEEWNGFGDGED